MGEQCGHDIHDASRQGIQRKNSASQKQVVTSCKPAPEEAVNHAFESFLQDGLADERRAFYFLFSTEDQKEGMKAFIEKRSAQWKGE